MQQNSGKRHKDPYESKQKYPGNRLEIKAPARDRSKCKIKAHMKPACHKNETWQSEAIKRIIKFHLAKRI